jgi:hypothetical protein
MRFILALFIFSLSTTNVFAIGGGGGEGGGQETNGGDGFVAEYLHVFDNLMKELPNKIILPNGKIIFKQRLINGRLESRYASVEYLILESIEKGASNQPYLTPPTITISRTFWKALTLEGKRLLTLHEQLFIAGYDDTDYSYSSAAYDRIVNGQTYDKIVLNSSLATCDEQFFDRLSKADFDESFPSLDQQNAAFYAATIVGCLDFIKLWAQWGKNVNQCILYTPLSAVVQSNRIKDFPTRFEILKTLVQAGALPNLECSLRQSACKMAKVKFEYPENQILFKLMKCK